MTKVNNKNILFKAKWTCPGGTFIDEEDELRSLYWVVYTDGTVKSRARYITSGYTGYRKAKLAEEEFDKLNNYLKKVFICIAPEIFLEDVGEYSETWVMTLYDEEGNEVHKISGYIGFNEKLGRIVDILKSLPFQFSKYGRKRTFFSEFEE